MKPIQHSEHDLSTMVKYRPPSMRKFEHMNGHAAAGMLAVSYLAEAHMKCPATAVIAKASA